MKQQGGGSPGTRLTGWLRLLSTGTCRTHWQNSIILQHMFGSVALSRVGEHFGTKRQDELVSLELIQNEIRRFLSTAEPEVICISGHWGVGKTFAWNRFLRDASQKGIALKRYSYVSLFGVNSLEEFKYSIFENSVKSSEIGTEPSLDTLQ